MQGSILQITNFLEHVSMTASEYRVPSEYGNH